MNRAAIELSDLLIAGNFNEAAGGLSALPVLSAIRLLLEVATHPDRTVDFNDFARFLNFLEGEKDLTTEGVTRRNDHS